MEVLLALILAALLWPKAMREFLSGCFAVLVVLAIAALILSSCDG
ncbi:MAG: hypothetical protein OXJ53_21130 [Gammaproteobacteria bacterium]|nr:hypothetical protein [Gammaproteobacteria bacterium]MDE0272092.1 hypothetical protein [Gammaproteobacteria bacterium]